MRFLMGTVRPISLLAWIPVVVGACLAGSLGYGILYGSIGAILSVGWINAFNNIIDRFWDQHNPNKQTLAVEHPVKAYEVALYLLPGIALMLRHVEYNNVLLSFLFYLGYWYSYLFGRVPYLKRAVVALCVTGTSFMLARHYPPQLWMWVAAVVSFIFVRETRKDHEDVKEDVQFRFVTPQSIDWWCVTAPLLGATIFLVCVASLQHSVSLGDAAIAIGITVAIWSYVQIRTTYGRYRAKLRHRAPAGRMGIIVALVGLMPAFVSTALLIVVWINSVTILYRSYLPTRFGQRPLAAFHDAALWASLPVIAACKTGIVTPVLGVVAGVLFFYTLAHQCLRDRHLPAG